MAAKHKKSKSLPINDDSFHLPSKLPPWPAGDGFATGFIELGGGLQVLQVSEFEKIWFTEEGGHGDLGVSFFDPIGIPADFAMLGCYCQPNSRPRHGWVLVAKDSSGEILKEPDDYSLSWSSSVSHGGEIGCIWEPVPPQGYKAVGYLVTTSMEKPPLSKIRCVKEDLTEECEVEEWIWGSKVSKFRCCAVQQTKCNIFSLKPKKRGMDSNGVCVGTFGVSLSGQKEKPIALSCLANLNVSSMKHSCLPNMNQIESLLEAYSPMVFFHPEEQHHPSSVEWYLENCLLVHCEEGHEHTVLKREAASVNLPRDLPEKGACHLDSCYEPNLRDKVKKGNLQEAQVYVHVKPMLGGTFTDIVVWFFYPFNGPGRITLMGLQIPFQRTGQHSGDWEHMTLRISNFSGQLWKVYFSQHSRGVWVHASELEYYNATNRVVAYSSLHGHAMFPCSGKYVKGMARTGAVDCCDKSDLKLDCSTKYVLVSACHLPDFEEPPWLDYGGRWGATVEYTLGRWVRKVENSLPKRLGVFFRKLVFLPNEVLGEDTPKGPKTKDCWCGDERVHIVKIGK